LEDTLEELREALRELKTEEVTNTGAVSGTYGSADTITLSGTGLYNNNTVIGAGYTVSTGLGLNYPNALPNGTYTINSTTGINWGANITASPWATTASPTIQLDGEGADIKVNGWSLINAIQKIEERLNILHPNTELEKEWDELKALGDRYRELEAKLKEQGKMWDKLKSMPPSDPLY
jgi:hypothetical protein